MQPWIARQTIGVEQSLRYGVADPGFNTYRLTEIIFIGELPLCTYETKVNHKLFEHYGKRRGVQDF